MQVVVCNVKITCFEDPNIYLDLLPNRFCVALAMPYYFTAEKDKYYSHGHKECCLHGNSAAETCIWEAQITLVREFAQMMLIKGKILRTISRTSFLGGLHGSVFQSQMKVETVTPGVWSSLSDDTWGLLLGLKESYQCIPAVCIVSPVKDGLGQAAIGLRSMFTSHLSYRAGSLPSAQTESPFASPLSVPSPPFTASAVEQQAGYDTDKVRAVGDKPQKTQNPDGVKFSFMAEECILQTECCAVDY